MLNVSRPFVVKLAKDGYLPHHMVGNRHRFYLADVLPEPPALSFGCP